MTDDPLETILADRRPGLTMAAVALRHHAIALAMDAARIRTSARPRRYGDVELDAPELEISEAAEQAARSLCVTIAASVNRHDPTLVDSAYASIFLEAAAELEILGETAPARQARQAAGALATQEPKL